MDQQIPVSTFMAALNDKQIEASVRKLMPLTIVGIVKAAGADHLEFSHGSCDDWLSIPISLIESIEPQGMARCKDHSHPRVRLLLKRPESKEALRVDPWRGSRRVSAKARGREYLSSLVAVSRGGAATTPAVLPAVSNFSG
jgi:hypothetical protein